MCGMEGGEKKPGEFSCSREESKVREDREVFFFLYAIV